MTAETTTITADEPRQPAEPEPAAADEVTIAELLVEEVSIDGMCGVY